MPERPRSRDASPPASRDRRSDEPAAGDRRRGALPRLACALWLLVPSGASGSFIALQPDNQLSFRVENDAVVVRGSYAVVNEGDELARDVTVELSLGPWSFVTDGRSLGPGEAYRWELDERFPLAQAGCADEAGDDCAGPRDLPLRGRLPLQATHHYQDRNWYPFSSIAVTPVELVSADAGRGEPSRSAALSAELVLGSEAGQRFGGSLHVRNPSDSARIVSVSFVVPRELESFTPAFLLHLEPGESSSTEVELENRSGLAGSSYEVVALVQWEEEGFRNFRLAPAVLHIGPPKTSRTFLPLAALAIGLPGLLFAARGLRGGPDRAAPWWRGPSRMLGLVALFGVVGWSVALHLPILSGGYLSAGDDHVHVAFSNELARIWRGEGRLLGWSHLYATGAPIFLLRPPGFYVTVVLCHFLTGLPVEQSIKLVVLLGVSLYPLTVFLGARLLGLAFWPALLAGLLALLPISSWGHTLAAYHFLGVHKQMYAILLFPIATGALWRSLKDGRWSPLFAFAFPAVFMTHPYIAYCLALLAPAMLFALLTSEERWNWRRGIGRTTLWSIPALLFCLLWLLPFASSGEIQVIDPFLGMRKEFDVVVCTTAETLRQFFLGGLFDTTAWSGAFGDHEWGWLPNGDHPRPPLLTALTFAGWCGLVLRRRRSTEAFVGLAFLTGLLIFIGPDDFPFLDRIPFAQQFQNIHSIFMLEWAAILVGGLGWHGLCAVVWGDGRSRARKAIALVLGAGIGGAWLTALAERTAEARDLITIRSVATLNGKLLASPMFHPAWSDLQPVVRAIQGRAGSGGISTLPSSNDDGLVYNVLPLMVDRPVFTSAFEEVGGVYGLLLGQFRSALRENPRLQRLFDVRFVLSSALYETARKSYPDAMQIRVDNKYWQLYEVPGEFGPLEALPAELVGFVGSERSWAILMRSWLQRFADGAPAQPWLVNLGHASDDALRDLAPLLGRVVVPTGTRSPEALGGALEVEYADLDDARANSLLESLDGTRANGHEPYLSNVRTAPLGGDRSEERFAVETPGATTPLLFKRSFYRGWRATVDGRRAPIYQVSPGLQMVLLAPGEHVVGFSYSGPNRWVWAEGAVCAGLVLSGLFGFAFSLRLRDRERDAGEARPSRWGGAIHLAPNLVWGIFVSIFALQAYAEAVLRIPVEIRAPMAQRKADSAITFHWNHVVGIPKKEQRFRLEVATDPEFQRVVQVRETPRTDAGLDPHVLDPGDYFYRLRLESGDRKHPWSSTKRLRVAE